MIHAQNLGESEENSITHDNCLKHHDLANQGLDTPDSLLPLSEPPDITNWFSSYEYESLVLETNDNFGFSDHEDSSTGNIVEAVENSRDFIASGEKKGMMKKRTSSSTLIKCKESEEDNKPKSQIEKSDNSDLPLLSSEDPFIEDENWLSSYAYESPEVDCVSGHHHKQSMLDKEKEECCNGKVENGENLCVPDDLISNKSLEEDNDGSDKENVQELSTEKVNSSEKGDVKVQSSTNKQCSGGDSDSGFVSITKNKRENDENSVMMSGKSLSSLKNEKRAMGRKTLGDRTNIQKHSYPGEEITGKWKCPRKSKPEIGPPLKQLRLGQWFRHV